MIEKSPAVDSTVLSIARAIRFSFASVVIGASFLNISFITSIHHYRVVFYDMLGGTPLPAATTFVVRYQHYWFGLSILIPSAAVGLLFTRRLAFSLYAFGFLIILVLFQIYFTREAMFSPFFEIIRKMQGDPGPPS